MEVLCTITDLSFQLMKFLLINQNTFSVINTLLTRGKAKMRNETVKLHMAELLELIYSVQFTLYSKHEFPAGSVPTGIYIQTSVLEGWSGVGLVVSYSTFCL